MGPWMKRRRHHRPRSRVILRPLCIIATTLLALAAISHRNTGAGSRDEYLFVAGFGRPTSLTTPQRLNKERSRGPMTGEQARSIAVWANRRTSMSEHKSGRSLCSAFTTSGRARQRRSPFLGTLSTRGKCVVMRAAIESNILGDGPLVSTADAADGECVTPNVKTTGVITGVNVSAMATDTTVDVNSGVKGTGLPAKGAPTQSEDNEASDIPRPTVNGGFTHTNASRAKISAANKGKTPWNKGKARSEEVKARIAAGVRAKNRERFLKKLADLGMTEEEYEKQKKEEKRRREAERRARRTEKGGYRPTEETKAKISAILKEKWAKGEVKKRAPSTGARRTGFKHSEETKQKIRESLRRRWAEDPEYRTKKEESARKVNSGLDARKRIANTLKKKWEDPEFRAYMMERIAQRKKPKPRVGSSHREKISQAMKKKWQDKAYREKALAGMKKKMEESPRPARPKTASRRKILSKDGIYAVSPMTKKKKVIRKTKAKKKANGAVVKKTRKKKVPAQGIEAMKPLTNPKVTTPVGNETEERKEGSIARLRQERRDLYDLLYGDDGGLPGATEAAFYDKQTSASGSDPRVPVFSPSLPSYSLDDDDDENLDNFDPYGLEDF